MDLRELVLAQLAAQDQQQLRQMLNVAAVRAYLSSKPGLSERFSFNHHTLQYEWGHGGSAMADLHTHKQPPLLRLAPPELMSDAELVSFPVWKEIPLDEHVNAVALLQQIDEVYALYRSWHNRDNNLLPLLDRTLPTRETLRRLCEIHQIENPEPILALAQPAIRILTRRAEEEYINHVGQSLGHSHFGGQPDLPKGMDWPFHNRKPMAFIGQINMDDIGEVPGRSQLPEHGILFFFSAFAWGEDYSDGLDYEDPHNSRVIYYDGPLDREHIWPQNPPPGMPSLSSWGGQYPYTTLQFAAELSLPSPEEVSDLPAEVSYDLYQEMYYDFNFLTDDYFRHAPQHQLLGHAWPIQGFSPAEGESLLIQVDSDYWEADFQWGDGGMLYFVLPKTDLQKRDVSHCRCFYECE